MNSNSNPSPWRRFVVRIPSFETCEHRTALAALPLAQIPVDHSIAPHPALLPTASGLAALAVHQLTGLTTVRANYDFTGAGQTVVVIDSGVAYDHRALGGGFGPGFRVVGGYDFAEQDSDPFDDGPGGSHGTHAAGIIAGSDPAALGVSPGVDIVALRVFDDHGRGDFAWVEQALQWVHIHRTAFRFPITTVNLSIGASWNGTTSPDWTTLEDEFAQLEADGLFIAVAAGNAFDRHHAAGLSYPAASPHVVPVGSIDADGSLSAFSQRHDRALFAPGRSIRSTVPDYAGNFNYRTDDYAQYTGTSMAAPYLAGAAVLVREAFASVGQTDVNQDTIYDLLRATADEVYDPITTQPYKRLNLARAIAAIVPEPAADDRHAVVIRRAGTTVEILGTDGDDTFTAQAGATHVVTVNGAQYHFDADVTRITFDGRGGHDSATLTGTSAPETASSQPTRAQLRGGRFEFLVTHAEQVRLHGGGGADSATLADSPADDALTLDPTFARLAGPGHQVELHGFVTIAVTATAGHDTALLRDSPGNDSLVARPDSARWSSRTFAHRIAGFDVLNVQASRGGYDVATLYDSLGDDVFTAEPTHSRLVGPGYEISVAGCDAVYAQSRGGHDSALFHDSPGNDDFLRRAGRARMIGPGYLTQAAGFHSVRAVSQRGGKDQATLDDSAGADLLRARANWFQLLAAGETTEVTGFTSVVARVADLANTTDVQAIDFVYTQVGR